MLSPDIALPRAAVDAILTMSPCPVPSTTLTADAHVGDTSLTVADGSKFPDTTLVGFLDATTEPLIPAAKPTALAIPLNTTGMGQTGLAYEHTSGTVVYCNLYDQRLLAPGALLQTGQPLFELSVVRQESNRKTMPNGWRSIWTLHIVHTLRLEPPPGQTMDRNVWALLQQTTGRQALDDVLAHLKRLHDLSTTDALYHIGGTGAVEETRDWSRLVGSADSMEFSAFADVLYYTDIGYQ